MSTGALYPNAGCFKTFDASKSFGLAHARLFLETSSVLKRPPIGVCERCICAMDCRECNALVASIMGLT